MFGCPAGAKWTALEFVDEATDVYQATYGYTEDVGMKNEIILATYLDKFIEDKEFFPAPYMYIPH